MKKYLEELHNKVAKMKWNVDFGSDWVVVAEPVSIYLHLLKIQLQSTNKVEVDDSSVLLQSVKYKSPIQEQQEVFPIDED